MTSACAFSSEEGVEGVENKLTNEPNSKYVPDALGINFVKYNQSLNTDMVQQIVVRESID